MGTLLYAAVSLLGRETDRITHVLVEPPYESQPDFWFPGQTALKTGRAKSKTRPPWVELADIPFVPLRRKIVDTLGREPGSFLTLSALCREAQETPVFPLLSISESTIGCRVDGHPVRLGPREHSLLLFLCEHALSGNPPLADYTAGADAWLLHRTALHGRCSKMGEDWRVSCRQPIDSDCLKHDISSIREKLKKAGPAGVALGKLLPARGRCSLALPPDCIDLQGI